MQSDYFSVSNLALAFVWFVLLIAIGFFIRNTHTNKRYYRFFIPHLVVKLLFSGAFAYVYFSRYGGGDTLAYFQGAERLNNLFFESPSAYFQELFSTPSMENYRSFYNSRTGFPPGWIYREPESFFTCKILSVLMFFYAKSYLALSFILAFFSSIATWKLFELIMRYRKNSSYLIYGILFLPSVNFWCTGISKDTIIYISILFFVISIFRIFNSKKIAPKNVFILLISTAIIYHSRTFILLVILVPLLFSLSARFVRWFGGGDFAIIAFRSIVVIIGIAFLGGSFVSKSEDELLQSNSFIREAAIVQGDFASNDSYGTNRYSIGEIEYTVFGLIKTTPSAVAAGIYRPFIWEATKATLILNGIESLILLFLSFNFIFTNFREKLRIVQTNEFYIFCLVFVLLIAFITGLTSGLFGVLVRLRAPLLPFLLALLTLQTKFVGQQNKKVELVDT